MGNICDCLNNDSDAEGLVPEVTRDSRYGGLRDPPQATHLPTEGLSVSQERVSANGGGSNPPAELPSRPVAQVLPQKTAQIVPSEITSQTSLEKVTLPPPPSKGPVKKTSKEGPAAVPRPMPESPPAREPVVLGDPLGLGKTTNEPIYTEPIPRLSSPKSNVFQQPPLIAPIVASPVKAAAPAPVAAPFISGSPPASEQLPPQAFFLAKGDAPIRPIVASREEESFSEFVKDRTRTGSGVANVLPPTVIPPVVSDVGSVVEESPGPKEKERKEDFTDYLDQVVAQTKKTLAETSGVPKQPVELRSDDENVDQLVSGTPNIDEKAMSNIDLESSPSPLEKSPSPDDFTRQKAASSADIPKLPVQNTYQQMADILAIPGSKELDELTGPTSSFEVGSSESSVNSVTKAGDLSVTGKSLADELSESISIDKDFIEAPVDGEPEPVTMSIPPAENEDVNVEVTLMSEGLNLVDANANISLLKTDGLVDVGDMGENSLSSESGLVESAIGAKQAELDLVKPIIVAEADPVSSQPEVPTDITIAEVLEVTDPPSMHTEIELEAEGQSVNNEVVMKAKSESLSKVLVAEEPEADVEMNILPAKNEGLNEAVPLMSEAFIQPADDLMDSYENKSVSITGDLTAMSLDISDPGIETDILEKGGSFIDSTESKKSDAVISDSAFFSVGDEIAKSLDASLELSVDVASDVPQLKSNILETSASDLIDNVAEVNVQPLQETALLSQKADILEAEIESEASQGELYKSVEFEKSAEGLPNISFDLASFDMARGNDNLLTDQNLKESLEVTKEDISDDIVTIDETIVEKNLSGDDATLNVFAGDLVSTVLRSSVEEKVAGDIVQNVQQNAATVVVAEDIVNSVTESAMKEIEIVSSLDPADDSIEVIQEEDFELSSEPAGGIVMTHSTASGSQLSSLSKDKTSVAEVRDEMDSWVIQGKETEEDLGNLDDEFAKIMATARKMEEKTKQRGDSDSVPIINLGGDDFLEKLAKKISKPESEVFDTVAPAPASPASALLDSTNMSINPDAALSPNDESYYSARSNVTLVGETSLLDMTTSSIHDELSAALGSLEQTPLTPDAFTSEKGPSIEVTSPASPPNTIQDFGSGEPAVVIESDRQLEVKNGTLVKEEKTEEVDGANEEKPGVEGAGFDSQGDSQEEGAGDTANKEKTRKKNRRKKKKATANN